MALAITEAKAATAHGDVPVGALVVIDGEVVASRHNERELTSDPTAHAELLAIRDAATATGSWRLANATVVVTLEPCPMCAGAIVQARIPTVIYGTADPKGGACHTLYRITDDDRLNHRCTVLGGVMEHDCRAILQEFFRARRAEGKK